MFHCLLELYLCYASFKIDSLTHWNVGEETETTTYYWRKTGCYKTKQVCWKKECGIAAKGGDLFQKLTIVVCYVSDTRKVTWKKDRFGEVWSSQKTACCQEIWEEGKQPFHYFYSLYVCLYACMSVCVCMRESVCTNMCMHACVTRYYWLEMTIYWAVTAFAVWCFAGLNIDLFFDRCNMKLLYPDRRKRMN